MSNLPSNVDVDDYSSSNIITNQNDFNINNSINDTFNSIDKKFTVSDETMRILFIAIATITVLICLTICLTVCICICLKRRRKLKQQDNKDQLLPEQSNKPLKTATNILTNGKQGSSIQPINSNKMPLQSFYHDTLDDIPFIDESRPTSVVDITQV